jgi:hypothetical protein
MTHAARTDQLHSFVVAEFGSGPIAKVVTAECKKLVLTSSLAERSDSTSCRKVPSEPQAEVEEQLHGANHDG